MGETERHVHWTIRLRDILKHRYREQQVYIGANMFIYYVEGAPYRNVCPDVFVVTNCDPHMRDIFKVWEERKAPDVVFEITSKGTRTEDEDKKPDKYALIGVQEYFLYDPRAEYLSPPLAGFRMHGEVFRRIEPNSQGSLVCTTLGITLELDGRDLLLRDAASGEVQLTSTEAAEAERQRAEAERQRAEAAQQRAEEALQIAGTELRESRTILAADRARIAQLEAELARLRLQLGDAANPD
jgi:Uma2 family endonuclease